MITFLRDWWFWLRTGRVRDPRCGWCGIKSSRHSNLNWYVCQHRLAKVIRENYNG